MRTGDLLVSLVLLSTAASVHCDRVIQPFSGGPVQVTSTLFQPNLQSSIGTVARGLQKIFSANSSAVQSQNGVLVALDSGSFAVSPSIINSTSTVVTAAVAAGTGTAYLEAVPAFVAAKAFTPAGAVPGSLLSNVGPLRSETVTLSPVEQYILLASDRVLPLTVGGGSTGAPFIAQASSGLPASASATQAASGATQGITSSINLIGGSSAITPLPATATTGSIAQGPNGQVNLQPAVLAPGQAQSPNGGGTFATAPAPSQTTTQVAAAEWL
ncbi:hypothetical protein WJX73_006735 [Symbiochloris irregularis]|uniref:Uncharacterized protein n=1 Tax=Symbiochloris irregularis TaxID=706552 RepID=A0AAW1NPV3_9CHLO